MNGSTFNVTDYIAALKANFSLVPIAGLALSGGGARATLSGYGAWQALDNRWPPSVQAGTGRIAQALTYISGLSGGGVPTGGIAMSNYPTTEQLLSYGNALFNISASAADSSNQTLATQVVEGWFEQIGAKYAAGFNISVTDVFAFVLGSEFLFNQSIPGLDVPLMARTWSDIQSYSTADLPKHSTRCPS